MYKKIKILIVEHQKDHHRRIKNVLKRKGIKVLSPEFTPSLELIKKSVIEDKPTDIFTDFFFDGGDLLEDILDLIGIKNLKKIRIWIISGYDISYQEMTSLRSKWPMIQDAWLAKPFDDEELSAFIDSVKKLNPTKIQLNGTPLPIRLIDSKTGKVTFLNAWPMAQNRPDLPEGINHNEIKMSEYWHHAPGKEVLLYGINSFLSVEDQDQICQIATKINLRKRSLYTHVELIFATMKDAGFLRGRFYQIIRTPDTFESKDDNICGLMEMSYRSGESYPEVKLPVHHPIKKFWSSRIIKAEKKINVLNKKEDLTYTLLHHSGVLNTDEMEDFFFWRNISFTQKQLDIIPKNKIKENRFLEIPIFRKKESIFTLIGFFCFDCYNGKHPQGPPPIMDDQIALVMKSLWSMINSIRTQIVDKSRVKKRKMQIDLDKADKRIKNETDLKETMSTFLDAAIEISDSDSGIIYYRSGFENHLKLIAKNIEFISPEDNFCILDKSSLWPIKVWKRNEMIISQNLHKRISIFEKIKSDIDQNLFSKKKKNVKWLEKWFQELGSVAIFPVRSGDRTLGSISLHKNKRYHYSENKIEAINSLIENCRWYLKYLTSHIRRSRREQILFHEIRSKLSRLNLSFQDKYFNNLPFEIDEIIPEMLNVQNLLNLSNISLSLKNPIERDKIEVFQVKPIIDYYIALYQNRSEVKRLVMPNIKKIDASLYLEGDRDDFEFIIGILIDNAVKFADKGGKIKISCNPDSKGAYCDIRVSNTGKISDEAQKYAFSEYSKVSDFKKDGSHIALSYSKKIVEYYGGSITIGKEKNTVITKFTWPIIIPKERVE